MGTVMEELDRLTADQERDDTQTIKPEFIEQVPFTDGLANCIGVDEEGQIVTNWPRPPKGTLLVGTAAWHGTYGGYKNYKCRCVPCRRANKDYVSLARKSGGS